MLPELRLIRDSDSPLGVSEIARITGKSQPTISQSLARARRKRFVSQLPDKRYVWRHHTKVPSEIDLVIALTAGSYAGRVNEYELLSNLAEYLAIQSELVTKALHAKLKGEDHNVIVTNETRFTLPK